MTAFPALVLLALLAADNSGVGTNGSSAGTPADTVLVQFHSTKCGPCRAMHPVMEKMAAAGYPLQQVDVDQQPQLAEQFRIKSLPTFALLMRGREVNRFEGSTNYDDLTAIFHAVGFRPNATPTATAATQPRVQQQFISTPADPANLHPTQGYVNNPAPAAPAAQPNAAVAQNVAANTQTVSPQQRAAWATVRLKVIDDQGFSFGTGTIIDRHDDEALVMTCGHIFRQSGGKGKIVVDLFAPGATQPVDGMLIAHDLDRDVALVSIRPTVKIEAVPVAPAEYAVAPRDRVFTIGCDKGAAPSLRNSHILAVNRYSGRPNFTAEGAPVDGRSGGGLFSESGFLIGVCNAAEPKENQGLYAGLASVHWQLDQIGQSAIYRDKAGLNSAIANTPAVNSPAANAPNVALTGFDQPAPAPNNFAAGNRPLPLAGAELPSMPPSMPRSLGLGAAAPPLNPVAAPLPLGNGAADDTEVIVILRSRSNPTKQSEIFLMDRPPAEIIRQLQSGASPAPRGSAQDLLRSAGNLMPAGGPAAAPIVRGQSQ